MTSPVGPISADSLYKFVAIVGLALFIAPSLIDKDLLNIQIEIVDIQKDMALEQRQQMSIRSELENLSHEQANVDLNGSARQIERSQAEINEVLALINEMKRKGPPYSLDTLSNINRRLESLGIAIDKNGIDVSKAQRQIDELTKKNELIGSKIEADSSIIENRKYDLQKIDLKLTYLRNANILEAISRTFGAVLLFGGLFLWYMQIQRHIDEDIRRKGQGKRVRYIGKT